MATLTTDDRNVALYDDVRGIAFGPTFESAEHALDYLKWCGGWAREFAPALNADRPQSWNSTVHHECYGAWFKARCDGESGELRDALADGLDLEVRS